ncbi:MAG: Methyl-coenzyme M reductase I subunit gamma [Candidatus Bathyarchaeota archaeon BA1]|uniref:coenzyme-B sulfoethylthiotransferase n=1 Tax=uncultured Bathyarchaeota archaeon TaxID=1739975 RepID=A0A0P0KV96_9ARCH|nr:methyl-coenzyme M reductase subunit gamma [uncultured Bathyarchaeota archaeon]KPV65185.1 MAG: Methyl-coenzyme M reductase I subunit gamma [Candidatus Bathyarchaeota archaeon BA1]
MPSEEKPEKKEFEPQIYPGADEVSERRKKLWDKRRRLAKYREVPDDDLTRLLGHRAVGALYVSVHPPLEELIEPYDPIKNLVVPTPGARAGDRIRFVQFSDSFWHPPITPYARARLYFNRFRGIDTVVYSGRCILEMRERDLEEALKTLIETEVFNPARTALKGITIHGHSLRLDEDGLMFDARRRFVYDKDTGEVSYIKDQLGRVLDQPVPVGRPLREEECRKLAVTYSWDTHPFKSRTEVLETISRNAKMRVMAGYNPESITDQM